MLARRMSGYLTLAGLFATPLLALDSDWLKNNSNSVERLLIGGGLVAAAVGVVARIRWVSLSTGVTDSDLKFRFPQHCKIGIQTAMNLSRLCSGTVQLFRRLRGTSNRVVAPPCMAVLTWNK